LVKAGEDVVVNVLPGEEDSILVARKKLKTFGNMAQFLDRNLIDNEENVVVAGCKVKRRPLPLKPFIFLNNDPKIKYIIVAPCTRNMVPLRISTKPYQPVQIDFTIVNPASSQFMCEIQAGRDLIAPSVIKIPPQTKLNASFAVNPDHSGEMETFITFHDCNMRIIADAQGPDIILKCAAIRD
jgi:hypothetical protein